MANINIDTSAELNLVMEAMTDTTRAKYDVFNARYKQILENDNALNKVVEQAVADMGNDMETLTNTVNASLSKTQTALEAQITKINRITTVTFNIDGWVGESAPYTNTVALANATGADDERPEIYMNVPEDLDSEAAEAYVEAFSYITKYETGEGTITATAMYEKPEANVSVDVKGV